MSREQTREVLASGREAIEGRTDPVDLALAAEKARNYAAEARAGNTRRAYAADWRDFSSWCARKGVESLPAIPSVVALYIAELAERTRPSTIQRRLTTVSQAHKAAGYDSPTVHQAVCTGPRHPSAI
jgi:hypothetical protein